MCKMLRRGHFARSLCNILPLFAITLSVVILNQVLTYIPWSILHSHTLGQFPPSLQKTQEDGKIRQNLSPPQQRLQ